MNRGCVVQTHLFHDRIMRMDTVVLEEGATLGPLWRCPPPGSGRGPPSAWRPGDARGDEVPPNNTRWQGNPIAPWVKFRGAAARRVGCAALKGARANRRSTAPPGDRSVSAPTGNFGLPGVAARTEHRVQGHDQPAGGSATITAVTLAALKTFTLDLEPALGVEGDGERRRPFRSTAESCTSPARDS